MRNTETVITLQSGCEIKWCRQKLERHRENLKTNGQRTLKLIESFFAYVRGGGRARVTQGPLVGSDGSVMKDMVEMVGVQKILLVCFYK